jgi:predicted nuclease with TOPRIM domain
MKEQLEQRLKGLKSEFESGQKMLADLETQQATLKTTLLRISGAIQVLEELLSQEQAVEVDNAHVPEVTQTFVHPN